MAKSNISEAAQRRSDDFGGWYRGMGVAQWRIKAWAITAEKLSDLYEEISTIRWRNNDRNENDCIETR